VCEAFAEYLHRGHPQTAWQMLADRLLARLHRLKGAKGADDFSRNYERDRLSDWAICALERADREAEIIPLCITEAQRTGSYDRLVQRLMAARHYEDAEEWIKAGLRACGNKWLGLGAGLRDKFAGDSHTGTELAGGGGAAGRRIRAPSFAASLLGLPASQRQSQSLVPGARISLHHLENGELPWKHKGWPLPESGLDRPGADHRNQFP
jgi:hypothetical protein